MYFSTQPNWNMRRPFGPTLNTSGIFATNNDFCVIDFGSLPVLNTAHRLLSAGTGLLVVFALTNLSAQTAREFSTLLCAGG